MPQELWLQKHIKQKKKYYTDSIPSVSFRLKARQVGLRTNVADRETLEALRQATEY